MADSERITLILTAAPDDPAVRDPEYQRGLTTVSGALRDDAVGAEGVGGSPDACRHLLLSFFYEHKKGPFRSLNIPKNRYQRRGLLG